MMTLPVKLKVDPIAEALCEVRFDSQESSSVPELAIGRLTQNESWNGFNATRLPLSDVPAPIRIKDQSLKYQAVIELREPAGQRVAKIGANVVSYHRLAPYPGWEQFEPEIHQFLDYVFRTLSGFNCTRVGFRYINAFSASRHNVSGIAELNYKLTVADRPLVDSINLNYMRNPSENHEVLVRLASPQFVTSPTESDLSVLVDIDVFTPAEKHFVDVEDVKNWVNAAHNFLKIEFFNLFTDTMKSSLVEE